MLALPKPTRWQAAGEPTTCQNCREPFKANGNHFRAWHGKDDKYYCSEDCEQDALEADARRAKVFA